MDDDETLHRRARYRELIEHRFNGSVVALQNHIDSRRAPDGTPYRANQGELSSLKKDNGPKSFGDRKAKVLAEQIGLHRRWFDWPLGTALTEDHWLQDRNSDTRIYAGDLFQATAHHEVREASTIAPESGDYLVPRLQVQARAGHGGLAMSAEQSVGSISITDRLLRQLPYITGRSHLRVIEAYGRSMEPTLQSGDLLMVDTGVNHANIDGIYILMRQNTPEPEIMVKRIQRNLDGGLVVRSDNRAEYDPEVVQPDEVATKIRILGRVVWSWSGRSH